MELDEKFVVLQDFAMQFEEGVVYSVEKLVEDIDEWEEQELIKIIQDAEVENEAEGSMMAQNGHINGRGRVR